MCSTAFSDRNMRPGIQKAGATCEVARLHRAQIILQDRWAGVLCRGIPQQGISLKHSRASCMNLLSMFTGNTQAADESLLLQGRLILGTGGWGFLGGGRRREIGVSYSNAAAP